jgi:signal transduction histidine kinase
LSSHWTFSAVALAGGLCLAGYTLYVWRHRRASAGHSLAVMLAAAGWWGLAYALELGSTSLDARRFWGDAKWLGIALLPVAFYAFVLQYTGRERLVTKQIMAALAVVPVATVALLAVPATHDLVRYYPPEAAADPSRAIAQVGPLFWPFLVYANLVVWGSTAVLVWTLTRLSPRYWRQSLLLIVAVLLPSLANVAHNLNLGPFRHVEPTPFLFVLTGAVFVWGLFRFRLLDLAPVAQRSVFETMQDGVLVLDPYRRVVKLNPAAERALAVPAGQAVGRPAERLLGVAASVVERADDPVLPEEVELGGRRFELTTTPLRDRGSGRVTGRVVELRDVTERHHAHERLLRLDQQRRWLLGRVVWAQEEERRRIAGEVHDDAIQTIAAARLMLTTFRDQLSDDYQRGLLDTLEDAVSSSLARLRTLVFDLRPAQLDDDGLAAALREYLAEAAGQGGFTAELRDDLEQEPPAEARVIAYRICQEALTNVRVHARAHRVEVRLEEARGGLLVSVADDGEGFDPDRVRAIPRRGHVGLTSMSERATMADGWCRVDSAPGQGTTVRFWLPTKDSG